MDLTVCPKCGAVRLNKKWHYDNADKYIIKSATSHVIMDKEDKISSVTSYNIGENEISMELVVEDRNLGDVEKEISINLKTYKESCPVCNKVTGSYYESVIQLRTYTTAYGKILEEAKDTIVKFMKNLNKQDPNSFISRIDTLKEGLDIYLGKKEDAVKIDKLMELDYFCNMKITKSLAGRKDSKDLFRYTHLVRILDLQKGSVVYNKAYYMVKNIKPNTIELLDIHNGSTLTVSSKEFFRATYRIVMKEPEATKFIVLSSTDNESQLMNSRTFEIITFRSPFKQKEVNLYKYEGVFYPL
ncbi:NMD protein affecting ribosome stability and mRNA decay [Ferroplasma acidiphilum]|uniref:NMD protein affecting ribosome stability and mRNA decay n=2 Tax=Ferroplasma acidiphilum TaxID=74969 RepID=A0A1V0N2L4_9ARCH|nr:NMD protein affecting ribosome stability and mRNA decay [Ferroplasma acidiphilum]